VIELRVIPAPGGGATLHLTGLGGWAAFDLDRAQLERIHQATGQALRQPAETAGSLAEFLGRLR